VNTSVKWPVGIAAAKTDGVAAVVKQTPGYLWT
jgi:ABC-type phosphate transport system substrate-binding protein